MHFNERIKLQFSTNDINNVVERDKCEESQSARNRYKGKQGNLATFVYLVKKLQCNKNYFPRKIQAMNLEESNERNTGWFEGRKEKEMMPLYYNLKLK